MFLDLVLIAFWKRAPSHPLSLSSLSFSLNLFSPFLILSFSHLSLYLTLFLTLSHQSPSLYLSQSQSFFLFLFSVSITFYLLKIMHSTHFLLKIILASEIFLHRTTEWLTFGRKEGNVLFNDTLKTFYSWLYGVRHMVKNHSERGILLLPHRLLFSISSKGSFICIIPQTG